MKSVPQNIDRLQPVFNDESLVADAGLLAGSMLADRLGLEDLVDATLRMSRRPGGANPGRKILTLVMSILTGGSHIDHADRLRSGRTRRVLGFLVMAPSTLGTFLRAFTWGHVSQLNKAWGEALRRVWKQGNGPGDKPVTIDVDSTIREVSGKNKQGAAYGHTKQWCYHPLLAVRAGTGEVVAARLRGGGSKRGQVDFTAEAVRRVRRAGASGPVTVRADAGFWSYRLIETLDRLGAGWSITVPLHANVRAAVEAIPEDEWTSIGYPEGGQAQVAETVLHSRGRPPLRLVVRRTGPAEQPEQGELWTNWRYHPFVTSSGKSAAAADRYHRGHASVELAVRDLKDNGLARLPSGKFPANAAWLACAVLAHNFQRWIAHHSGIPPGKLTVGRTIRNRLFGIPGRVVNHGGRLLLRLPARWPWARLYERTMASIRRLPMLS